jgi:hypothetical protein
MSHVGVICPNAPGHFNPMVAVHADEVLWGAEHAAVHWGEVHQAILDKSNGTRS